MSDKNAYRRQNESRKWIVIGILLVSVAAVAAIRIIGVGSCGSCRPHSNGGQTMAAIQDVVSGSRLVVKPGDLVGIVNSNTGKWGIYHHSRLGTPWIMVARGENGRSELEDRIEERRDEANDGWFDGGGSSGGGSGGGAGGGGYGGGAVIPIGGGTTTWNCGSGMCCNSSGTCVPESELR